MQIVCRKNDQNGLGGNLLLPFLGLLCLRLLGVWRRRRIGDAPASILEAEASNSKIQCFWHDASESQNSPFFNAKKVLSS
jgi:hypothetical protein